MSNKDNSKKHKDDNFQHKVFKATILFLVLIFFLLIIYFLKVEFFKFGSNVDSNFQLYEEKYAYFYQKVIIINYK